MTVSAVSMQMKNLESDLDIQLFDRSFRPPLLTPVARRILNHAEAIIQEEKSLRNVCISSDVLVGEFQLGLIMTASVRLLPRFMQNAAKFAPYARFKFSTGLSRELTKQVNSGRLDAAIVTMTESYGFLQQDLILTENLAFGIPKKAWCESKRVESLCIPFLHFSPHSGVGEVVTESLKGTVMESHDRIVLDSIEAIVECVNSGVGYTLLPEPDLMRYANDSVIVVESAKRLVREISLVTRKDSVSAKHRKAILDLFTVNRT